MFDLVKNFENKISEYFGSKYAVATDCCTHAIELCLRLRNIKKTKIPSRTYLSVPMTLIKLNVNWNWENNSWKEYYYLSDTNIIDAAVLWRKKSYIPGTMMCLSFQYKKHLNLGRGGMILLDDINDYEKLIKMSYDGRSRYLPWAEQEIESIGYHYYMTPETAQLGLNRFEEVKNKPAKIWDETCYPNISKLKIFKDYNA
jgi:dTDP-4-amino-4,6-dideoxygalactose transaminase